MTTVSVIIPARNAEPLIAAAVTSATTQSHPPDEILVIDDDSADATATVAARLPGPVRVIAGRFGSAAAARNEGLRQATGQLIAFLDADDVWLPESLSARIDALNRETTADYTMGLVTAAPAPGEPWPAWAPAAWQGAQLPGHLDAFLGRRDAVAAVGMFDPAFAPCEDVDWLARLKDSGARGILVDAVCAHYRLSEDGVSGSAAGERQAQLLRALRASAHRRKLAVRPHDARR